MGSISELIETIMSYLFGAVGFAAKYGVKQTGLIKPKKQRPQAAPVSYGRTGGGARQQKTAQLRRGNGFSAPSMPTNRSATTLRQSSGKYQLPAANKAANGRQIGGAAPQRAVPTLRRGR